MSQPTSASITTDALYIDERELTRRTTLAPRTLQLMRRNGGGPPFAKLGGRVVYKWADVERWIQERTRCSPASPGQGTACTRAMKCDHQKER